MLLRIDDIVSGLSKKQSAGRTPAGKQAMETDDGNNVDSERQLAE